MKIMHEEEFNRLLEKQIRSASGQRLERLKKDKTGERRLFCEVLRPVLSNLDDLILEYEMMSIMGVRIYLDMFVPRFQWAPECLGFVPHAQNISRERFDFEQVRIQTMAVNGIKYIPFSWDQLDKRPDQCRRVMFELLGRFTSNKSSATWKISIYEREIIRYALYLNKPFNLKDVSDCTELKEDACRKLLRNLMRKQLIMPIGKGKHRYHYYVVEPDTIKYFG